MAKKVTAPKEAKIVNPASKNSFNTRCHKPMLDIDEGYYGAIA